MPMTIIALVYIYIYIYILKKIRGVGKRKETITYQILLWFPVKVMHVLGHQQSLYTERITKMSSD